MIKAVLFDLDDTLLGNHMDKFLPSYFALLSQYASRYLEPKRFLQEMLASTEEMMQNTNTAVSNREAFWATFQRRTGLDPVELEPFFDTFYRDQFPKLQAVTRRHPIASQLVQACFDARLKVVIATNPLFPSSAIEQRLSWAGIPIEQYDYDLVTTYANMHAAKPNQAYYQEILARIDCDPQNALMVGDNWENDIVPTAVMGCFTYWITPNNQAPPNEQVATAYGSLEQLFNLVTSGWLNQLDNTA